MQKMAIGLIGLLMAVFPLVAACSGGQAEATGRAVFAVSDAAADMGSVTSIRITIDAVRVHAQGGAWIDVSTSAKTFDLLELDAKGTTELLTQADLKAGAYDQMELNVSQVVVVDAKGEHEAKLPSNKLHLKGMLEVEAGSTSTANFDFLADQSLHVTGEGRYILAPVIKLETRTEAKADVKANNEVTITGGRTTTAAEIGMDIEGATDAGLGVSPDAVLSVSASGKIVQTRDRRLSPAPSRRWTPSTAR